jgi:glycosyltransferase involved in cell wall biosynthesis
MKIAFIGQKGIPATFGGVEYHVDRLSRELAALGQEVTVYVRNWYTEKTLKSYRGVKLVHVPTIEGKHTDASVHSFLCSVHSLFMPFDIIHYHGIGPSFFSLIPKLSRRKIVCTIHRLDWNTEKWGKVAKTLLKIGEYISVKIPDRTIVVSDDLRQYVRDKYAQDSIHIPHGIDLSRVKRPELIKKKYGLKGNDYILFMGRLAPEKRIDWLIKAFLLVKNKSDRAKNIKLVIAGGPSATSGYEKQLEKMALNEMDIIFTGNVGGIEKEELMSNALLFVLPSYLEGFPIVLLEAKTYGLCILASDIPPHQEAINDGIDGMLFKSKDLFDFCKKLQFLIENPQKTEIMEKNSLTEVSRRKSWSEIAGEYLLFYRKLIESKRKS